MENKFAFGQHENAKCETKTKGEPKINYVFAPWVEPQFCFWNSLFLLGAFLHLSCACLHAASHSAVTLDGLANPRLRSALSCFVMCCICYFCYSRYSRITKITKKIRKKHLEVLLIGYVFIFLLFLFFFSKQYQTITNNRKIVPTKKNKKLTWGGVCQSVERGCTVICCM